MMRRSAWVLLFGLALTGCGGSNPYLEQSLKPAELQGLVREELGSAEWQGHEVFWWRNLDVLSHRRRQIRPAFL